MTNLTVRIPQRSPSPVQDLTKAYTPTGGTELVLRIGSKIGEGRFGSVFSARSETDANELVIKRPLEDDQKNEARHYQTLKNEKCAYDKAGAHRNIIGYLATTPRGSLVMPRALETLSSRLKTIAQNPNSRERKSAVLHLTGGMLKALLHLKKNGMTHNDTHNHNWMIGRDEEIKLIDPGRLSLNPEEGLADPRLSGYTRQSQILFFKNHPVCVIVRMFQKSDLKNCNEIKRIFEKTSAILIHDLYAYSVKKYKHDNPAHEISMLPAWSYFTESAQAFLQEDSTEMNPNYLRESMQRYHFNSPCVHKLTQGKTVRILEEILADRKIFPARQND